MKKFHITIEFEFEVKKILTVSRERLYDDIEARLEEAIKREFAYTTGVQQTKTPTFKIVELPQ